MPGIFIAALIVTGEWALIHVRRLLTDEPKVSAKLLALAMALTLPMCAIALFAVRIPFDAWLRGWLGAHPAYPWITLLYAPLTEEPAKLWPLLLPWVGAKVTRENATRVARALGLGFGLGEAWMLAWFIGQNPRLRPLPWTSYTGFISERFFVCLVHAFLTAYAVRGFAAGRRSFGRGVVVAMALHTLLNFPIVAARQWGFDPSDPRVVLTLFVWVSLFSLWAWSALARMEQSPPEPDAA